MEDCKMRDNFLNLLSLIAVSFFYNYENT